jgi:hypothetical protein
LNQQLNDLSVKLGSAEETIRTREWFTILSFSTNSFPVSKMRIVSVRVYGVFAATISKQDLTVDFLIKHRKAVFAWHYNS